MVLLVNFSLRPRACVSLVLLKSLGIESGCKPALHRGRSAYCGGDDFREAVLPLLF